jgi:hypothetical protein
LKTHGMRLDTIKPVLEKVTKNEGHEQTHVGDQNAPIHDITHEVHRKQNTGNRSATTRYIVRESFLQLFIY